MIVLAVGLGGLLFFLNNSAHKASAGSLNSVSTQGTPVVAHGAVAAKLNQLGASDVVLIARLRDRGFYRFTQSGYGCFGVGRADPFGDIQVWACGGLISEVHPIMDFSIVGATKAAPYWTVLRVEGIAADGVSHVAVKGADGSRIVDAPVINNAYLAESPPPTEAAALVAYDKSGRAVFSQPIPRAQASGG